MDVKMNHSNQNEKRYEDGVDYETILTPTKPGYRVCGTCFKELFAAGHFYKDGVAADGTTRYRRDCKICYTKGLKSRREAKFMQLYGTTEPTRSQICTRSAATRKKNIHNGGRK